MILVRSIEKLVHSCFTSLSIYYLGNDRSSLTTGESVRFKNQRIFPTFSVQTLHFASLSQTCAAFSVLSNKNRIESFHAGKLWSLLLLVSNMYFISLNCQTFGGSGRHQDKKPSFSSMSLILSR